MAEFFQPSRGLRKGDPLSPYLFLLCTKGFSAMLHRCAEVGTLHGQRILRYSLVLTHLFFTNDSLIFLPANSNDGHQLKQVLYAYELAFGQKVNFDKSAIYFSVDIQELTKSKISRIFNIPIVACHDRYFGLPTMIGKRKMDSFDSIKSRV